MQTKSTRKFTVNPLIIQFKEEINLHKVTIKNTSLRVQSFQVINPNQDHYKIQSGRKFTLAPGMSQTCTLTHIKCPKCHKNQFNKLRITSSQKQSILVDLQCPQIKQKQPKLISCTEIIDFAEFNYDQQKIINIPIKNISQNNLKLIVQYSSLQSQAFKLQLQEMEIILLKQRATALKGNLSFITGAEFLIELSISVISEADLSKVAQIQTVLLKGNALVKSQVIKNSSGKIIESINLKLLNGTSINGQFYIQNCYRKDCTFKLKPELNSSSPNEFASKWTESQITFSEPFGEIKAFQTRKITYEIKTKPNLDDLNFTQKFSKIDYNDEINLSRMKSSKYFKKNVDINLKAIYREKQNESIENKINLKIKVNIVNPAFRIKHRTVSNKEIFQLYNQTDLEIPYQIENNTLYKPSSVKGIMKEKKELIEFEWKKSSRPFSGLKSQMTTFSLAYGKCNLFLKLPYHDLQIFNFIQRQQLRPSTSTLKRDLGLQKSQSMMLKRPMSAVCGQMIAKKFHLVEEKDFYQQVPKFLPIEKLKNQQLEKVVVSSAQKGNVISNTWGKQITVYFLGKGYLVLKPLKTYLLPYSLQLSTFSINQQQFQLQHRHSLQSSFGQNTFFSKNISIKNKQTYFLSDRQLNFVFQANKKQFYVENSLGITNCSDQPFKAYLLTVQDEFFISSQEENKVVIHPEQTVSFRIKLYPMASKLKQTKISRVLEFLINGQKQQIICNGQLLNVDCDICPKQLEFTDCHYGQQEISKKITLTNCGFNKFNYEVHCPPYVSVSHQQHSGTIVGKGNAVLNVRFKPSTYLQNYKDHIKILIRGSHAILIPFLINTKKPNLLIEEQSIDFGQGIMGDFLTGKITIQNRNNSSIQCRIDLKQTELLLQNGSVQDSLSLKSGEKKTINLNVKIKSIGLVTQKLKKSIVSIPGYGPIKSPNDYTYCGKENIMEITPSGINHSINVEDIQSSYTIKLQSLINQKIQLKCQLLPQKKFDETFILSIEPQKVEISPYSQKEIMLNCLISDLEKLREIERNYLLRLFRKGAIKPYTTLKLKVHLPTPKLLIEPQQLYFPVIGLHQWSHRMFKIQNRGYKQVYFKIIKPTNIPFQLEVVSKFASSITTNPNENKLTKLNNEAEIRVSFKSKKEISFQNVIQIQDNFGNRYNIKFYGFVTNSPLLLSQAYSSVSISAKSIPSNGSLNHIKTLSSVSGMSYTELDSLQNEVEHGKFLNYWIGSLMPHMNKQSSFNQYLTKPQILIQFLGYFNIELAKKNEYQSLGDIIYQLRKLDIPLDIVNVYQLAASQLSEWIKFIFLFLSKRFINSDCLKWVSRVCGHTVDNYDVVYNNYKKIVGSLLNGIFFRVFKVKINEYVRILQRLEPFLEILFKIQSKKHLIIVLNILYYKFNNQQVQTVKSEERINHIIIQHNIKYERTLNMIVHDSSLQVVSNPSGVNPHINVSSHAYYFTLDKTHPQTQITIGLKQSCSICIINSTLFQKCHFVQYQLEEIQPKIHHVTIECEDKFTQQWMLDYQAPVDSQYRVQFVGDSQFKCKFNALGLIKVGKVIPMCVTYSPTNLNPHQATLTIMNKHFKQVYLIKGKPLFSRNIEYEKHIKVCQGKKHVEIIQIPWEHQDYVPEKVKKDKKQTKNNQRNSESELPVLNLVEYNQKRNQLLGHRINVLRQGKKDYLVRIRLEYQFNQIFKELPLLYQIINDDKTQSKIIRVFVKVIPQPINIEAQIRCKIQNSVTQKIPIQNLSSESQMVIIQFFKTLQQAEKNDQIQSKSYQSTDRSQIYQSKQSTRNQNQFRISRVGKIHLDPQQLQNIAITYRPDSLFETSCLVRLKYDLSQNVINYKFKGIPQFPSTVNEVTFLRCKVEQKKTFKIPLKSLVRQNTTFQVQTNIMELIGKDKITLSSGQTLQYPIQVFCHHSGTLNGELIFKSPQVTLVYPLQIMVEENDELIKKYQVSSKIRHPMTLKLELHNKSNDDITYDVFWDHEFIICPNQFHIQKNIKKSLEVIYLPFKAGQVSTKIKLYNPKLKQIIYEITMICENQEELIQDNAVQLMQPYTFTLPIKNNTKINSLIQKPNLPDNMKLKNQNIEFPISLLAGKTVKLEISYLQKQLTNKIEQKISIKTDCIGQYNYLCKFNILQTKKMQDIDILYKSQKSVQSLEIPFKAKFINQYSQNIQFHIDFQGVESNIFNSLKLKSSSKFTMDSYQTTYIQGEVKVNIPKKSEKALMYTSSNENIQNPIHLTLWTLKNKLRYEFIYPIKLIQLYENPDCILIKSNSYEMKKTLIDLRVIRQVKKWTVSDLSQDFIKNSISFVSTITHQNYLETIINKPLRYDGFITFFNSKNQAQRIPLKFQIGEPKYEPVVLSSNVGEKAVLQIQLKNGKGTFKVELQNNKTEEFGVQPTEGEFLQEKGQLVAKINFIYFPKQYSGIKRAKVAIISQHGCYYFNLMGKFKSIKKSL